MGKGDHLGEFEEIVLLAVGRLEGDGHGASIHEEILATTGRDVSIAAVYVTLSRLADKGYVDTGVELAGEERGGRPRKTFALAEAGIAELQRSRIVHARLWDGLDFDPLRAGD
ncbi:MAG: helix-turn-helix transcriptional regulator [Gemmatimonadota bacterium]|jgi:DNA-binding PadR family transcriptional regulator